MSLRINSFLARSGLGSRRHVESLVTGGRVTVNGAVCTDLATQVRPDMDEVRVNGKQVRPTRERICVMLNKPPGYVVSARDEFGRKTVFDLLPQFPAPVHAVGRLDRDSEGLLLLTSDGNLSQRLLHPSHKVEKTYKVTCTGRLTRENIETLRNGVALDDGKTLPARVFIKQRSETKTVLRMVIREGRNRQIRRMIEAIGSSVTSLKRLQVGTLKLGRLPAGMWRPLMPREIEQLLPRKDRL
ncbi:MAG: rRNA pseudouridine synthase [Candidatus Cloacimonetes bacterium]|nr:rRNA pseudouridine synthase [Candidatus Cloacimonadota bacterium]